jgi:hypothetical protein
VIREINYVTVNGLVLTEGVHYVPGADKGTVRISNRGSCEKEPKSYYYCPGKLLCRTLKTNAVRIAPVELFYSKQICR